MCRGGKGSGIRYENTGEKYSPIIISMKQTLQTIQAIITTTQKTKFLNGWNLGAVTTRYHQQKISSRDSGRSGGKGGEKRETMIFNTTNKGLCTTLTTNF